MAPTLPIVGIGASAGGVEALEQLLRSVPAENGLAFVVVTHLPPNRESMLADILGRATPMPVIDAKDGEKVEAEHVYILPPSAILTIQQGRLRLRHTGPADRERAPIDVFFNSLAEDQGEHAIGVVLSGGGHDGTLGIKAIKENGGLTIAQGANVSRPRFVEMPLSAVAGGFVDLELPVEDIPERIIAYVRNWGAFDPEKPGDVLANIHRLLRSRTGHDFSDYKERTFQRRVQRRMQVVQTTKLEEYAERLQKDAEEVHALFRDLLIGVTDFFRDAAAFQALETSVIPKLFEGKGADDEVRVWVAGCSTGEEAYSIAILLREQCEKLVTPPKVQIFATDIDETAMGIARAARYPANVIKEVSPERLRRFFSQEAGTYRVIKELRDMCIFSTHSVIRDPPFSRLDLISCRNLLIYLKPTLQAQIVPLFHYSLRPGGFLFLGSSENLSRYGELFAALDRKNRIFRRRDLISRPPLPLRQFLPNARREPGTEDGQNAFLQRSDTVRKLAATVVERFAPTFVIVDEAGQTLFFSSGTGKYLQPAAGPPNRDIVAMARPGLRADLRAALHRAKETGERVVRERIAVQINGGLQMISLAVERVLEGNETAYGIVFTDRGPIRSDEDVAGASRPVGEGEDATVRQIEKELQETKERLQSTIEELETANEEFRSSNEELLSVNEELQSTNEELETSKEELQSVNEELQTVNNELSIKIDELDRANADLNNLFQSTQVATIFLDRNLLIRSFTPAVTKLFNLIPNDRGRPLTDIVSRIDYPDLEHDMRRVCRGAEVAERSVKVSGGNGHYLARILAYRTPNNEIDGVLLTFVDISNIIAAEEQQKVLAAELSHRVKNTLAVVSSIAERSLPNDAAKAELLGRFHALGHTHNLLSQTGWIEAPLREIVSTELAPYAGGGRVNAAMNGPSVMLKPQAALLLALVFHELATNAAKYGALSTPEGRVEVAWTIAGDRPSRLELTWREHGGPPIDGFPTRGFGTELIERGIRFELQGEAKLDAVDGGLQCRIVIPADAQLIAFGSPPERPTTEEAAS
ncbi:MAG: PAS domain-containing protein [Alphaproteobacteria bacterium]|nr:PAS domain-containing protein [Alphaproteobacteria bacterium]